MDPSSDARPRAQAPAPLLLSLFLSLFLGAGCGDGERPLAAVAEGDAEITGRGVLVIVVDGLRWDHTSLHGYDRDTTPFLRRFGRECTVFEDAWSPTASRLGAHVAILTGCDPGLARPPLARPGAGDADERGESMAWFLPSALDLLGQPFLGAGWRTAAFVDDPMIAELRGFDRGFREFIEYGGDAEIEEERSIGVFGVGSRFVQWLYDLPNDADWFAYVHLDDLERVWADREENSAYRAVGGADEWTPREHLSRVVPIGVDEPMLHALPPSRAAVGEPLSLGEYELRYDRGIRGIDASLERLVGHAEEYGRSDLLTIVIVGSHGVALGEGGLFLQAGGVGEADLHVPMLIRPSAELRDRLGWKDDAGPRRARGIVSLSDLAPTLVEMMDLTPPEEIQGVSLYSMLEDPAASVRERVFLEAPAFGDLGIADSSTIVALREGEEPTVTRRRGARGPTPTAARGVRLLEGWEGLQRVARRALHYGEQDPSDAARADLRSLQVSPSGSVGERGTSK